jgi:hypothetical protein
MTTIKLSTKTNDLSIKAEQIKSVIIITKIALDANKTDETEHLRLCCIMLLSQISRLSEGLMDVYENEGQQYSAFEFMRLSKLAYQLKTELGSISEGEFEKDDKTDLHEHATSAIHTAENMAIELDLDFDTFLVQKVA